MLNSENMIDFIKLIFCIISLWEIKYTHNPEGNRSVDIQIPDKYKAIVRRVRNETKTVTVLIKYSIN